MSNKKKLNINPKSNKHYEFKTIKTYIFSVITFSCENDNTNIESHVEQQKFGEITLTKSIDFKY